MKVFKLSSQIFKLHCYLPLSSPNKWKYYACVVYTALSVVQFFFSGFSSWRYFVKSFSHDKSSAFSALYQVVVVAGPLYSFFVAQSLKKDIQSNFIDFQKFYDRNRAMDPLDLMAKAEMSGRRVVKFFVSFMVTSILINFVTGYGNLLYRINKDANFTNYEEVHRPYRYILPWDQSTLNGWVWEMVFSLTLSIPYFLVGTAFLTLLVTICEYHRSFCKIIDHQLTNIDNVLRGGTYRLTDLIKMYHETVTFHFEAKQLFVKSVDLFSYFIAPELISFMLLMTFVLYHLDYALRNLSLESGLMIMGLVYTTMVLYLYCNNGQMATDLYTDIADQLYNSEWMIAPVQLKRMYVMMIAHAQKEIHYCGYGIVELKLETFLRMINSIVGYVLMFKSFAEPT